MDVSVSKSGRIVFDNLTLCTEDNRSMIKGLEKMKALVIWTFYWLTLIIRKDGTNICIQDTLK